MSTVQVRTLLFASSVIGITLVCIWNSTESENQVRPSARNQVPKRSDNSVASRDNVRVRFVVRELVGGVVYEGVNIDKSVR